MAGWDHNLIGQEDKAQLARLLPVSPGKNSLENDIPPLRNITSFRSMRKSEYLTVGMVVDQIKPNHLVYWDWSQNNRLVASYVDNDREHYPSGRIVIEECENGERVQTDITKAVQLLFDFIYPKRT